ncbi:hypothetical protein CQ10_17140 [Bradyrhizobium valentinum]|nr:hypothetical protein CQ10_17140 [Bradyrhizobium valentinum]
MPGYKDDATALIGEPQFGALAMCLVNYRILQIRAGTATPGNRTMWAPIGSQHALDTLSAS